MSLSDAIGGLLYVLISAVVLLVFAILTFFVTVFIVKTGASIAGYTPSGDFVVLSAAILSGSSIVAGASPFSGMGGSQE